MRKDERVAGNGSLVVGRKFVGQLRRVLNHADDRRTGRIRSAVQQPLAHRASVREKLARQVLVYDRHAGRAGLIVGIGKGAAGNQRDAHSGKVLWTDGADGHNLRLAVAATKLKAKGAANTRERQVIDDGRSLNSR